LLVRNDVISTALEQILGYGKYYPCCQSTVLLESC